MKEKIEVNREFLNLHKIGNFKIFQQKIEININVFFLEKFILTGIVF